MSGPLKYVLLVGYGAVGAIYALILKRSGLARVTVVARSNYEIAKRDGMHFKSQKYGDIQNWKPDRLFNSVSDALDQPYSYVVVTTKAVPEVTTTSKLLAPFLSAAYPHPQPTYVLLQNGLNVESDLYQAVSKLGKGDPRIISTALYIGTNLLSENVVEHNDFDKISMGIYKPGNYTDTHYGPGDFELLQDFSEILKSGGTTITVVPEIQRVKFSKNFWNVAFSSIATLTRYPLPAVFRDPVTADRVMPTIRSILMEVLAVGRAMGFDEEALPSSIVETCIKGTADIHVRPDSKHKASMLLDLELGRPLEIEVILGEVVRKAHKLGVDIPRIETMYALLIVVQGQLLKN